MAHLFISYASADQAIAMEVCALLEARGVACWIAPRDVAPGAKWDEALMRAIDDCGAFLVLLSPASNDSPFVQNEVNRAFAKKKAIFTFRLDEVQPSGSLEFYLARHHWIDGFPEPIDAKVAVLAAAVSAVVSSFTAPVSAVTAGAAHRSMRSRRAAWRRLLPYAATSVITAAMVLGAAWALGVIAPSSGSSNPVRRSTLAEIVDGVPIGSTDRPALDAAGRWIVVRGRGSDGVYRLFARRLEQSDPTPVPGTDGATAFALSPDGAWLAFVSNQQLRKVALSGGNPVSLAPIPVVPLGLAWVRTDSVIVSGQGGLVRVPAGGGAPEPLTKVNSEAGETDHRWPSVTSDGKVLAYVAWTGLGDDSPMRLRSLEDGRERTIQQGRSPVLTTTGHLVFGRNGALWALSIDRGTLQPTGSAVMVQTEVDGRPNGQATFALSDDGTLAYQRRPEQAAQMRLVDRAGAAIRTLGEGFRGVLHGPARFSPDGASFAAVHHVTGGRDEIVMYDLRRDADRGTPLGGAGDSRWPVWTQNGTRLAFASQRRGSWDIFEVASGFGAEPESLLIRDGPQVPLSWTKGESGSGVLAFADGTEPNRDIWILRDGKASSLLANPALDESAAAFSPDGRWLAYVSNETGRPTVYLQRFPTADGRIAISPDGGDSPAWGTDGLYYTGPANEVHFVPVARGAAVPNLAQAQRLIAASDWDVSPDGRAFVAFTSVESSEPPFELVVNWFEELKARMAAAK